MARITARLYWRVFQRMSWERRAYVGFLRLGNLAVTSISCRLSTLRCAVTYVSHSAIPIDILQYFSSLRYEAQAMFATKNWLKTFYCYHLRFVTQGCKRLFLLSYFLLLREGGKEFRHLNFFMMGQFFPYKRFGFCHFRDLPQRKWELAPFWER